MDGASRSETPETVEGVARLAASQARRMRRIVDAAVQLADEGGFEAVRLRDVAEAADVALGTLYKYFPSKEDLLLFVVNEGTEQLEGVVAARPLRGEDAVERITSLFARATRGLLVRPELSRAALRAIATAGRASEVKVAAFHLRMTRLTVAALRGDRPAIDRPLSELVGTGRERQIALVLSQVWYAALLGWAGGLHPVRVVTERVRDTALLILGEAGTA
jgi:AcrR family transcriptional regulator